MLYLLRSRCLWALLVVFFCGAQTMAQNKTVFGNDAEKFHASLTRYFLSAQQEQETLTRLLDTVAKFHADSQWNRKNLAGRLEQYQRLLVSLKRHYVYRRLCAMRNTKDTSEQAHVSVVSDKVSLLQSFVNSALQQPVITAISAADWEKLRLTKFAWLLQQAKELAAHLPSVHDQEIVNRIGNPIYNSFIDRYDRLMDEVKAEPVTTPEGKQLDPLTNRSAIYRHKDAAVRTAGAAAYYKAYEQHREVIAATLVNIAVQGTALAKQYGYKSATERIYAKRLQLPEESVKEMLQGMTQYAGVLKNFQQVQAANARKITGLEKVHSWDLSVPSGYTAAPVQTFEEARQTLLRALAPLGNTYTSHFAWLMDPENGGLEIAGGKNRLTENTSVGFPGVPVSLYMTGYNGETRSTLVLIHEGGHAIHQQLMTEGTTVPSYSAGPAFLNEAFAMFNELLLLDEWTKSNENVAAKAFYTQSFASYLATEIFTSAEEGAFEQAVYDGVANGTVYTWQDVDSVYGQVMKQYDYFFADEPIRHCEWINKRLLFDDPVYNITYLYAVLVACKLYDMVHVDPADFAVRYTALLKNGFDAPAATLLKKFMGFGLDREALLNAALDLMRKKTAALQSLYAQMP